MLPAWKQNTGQNLAAKENNQLTDCEKEQGQQVFSLKFCTCISPESLYKSYTVHLVPVSDLAVSQLKVCLAEVGGLYRFHYTCIFPSAKTVQ